MLRLDATRPRVLQSPYSIVDTRNMIFKRPFIFIRHGESEGNKLGICQGHLDYPLTPLGRAQAEEAAKVIPSSIGTLSIFASSLKRASETADIISRRLSCPALQILDGLRERTWGELDGSSRDIIPVWRSKEAELDGLSSSSIAGFEKRSDFIARITATMNEILSQQHDQLPLVVGHGEFFHSLCKLLEIKNVDEVSNCRPALCAPNAEGWSITWMVAA